jgi:hypothetical protein
MNIYSYIMQSKQQITMGNDQIVEKCCEDGKSIFEVDYIVLKDNKKETWLVCEKHWNKQDEKGMKYWQVGISSKRVAI